MPGILNSFLVKKLLNDKNGEHNISAKMKKHLSQLDPLTVKLALSLPKDIVKQSGKFTRRNHDWWVQTFSLSHNQRWQLFAGLY